MVNPVTDFTGFRAPTQKRQSELDMQTFLRLLSVELSTQNPLEPMSDRDFFAQMAQLGQVNGMEQLKSSMETVQGASFIGKTVTALRPMSETGSGQNDLAKGVVEKLTMRDGKQYLVLKEANGGRVEVTLSNVREVEG